LECNGRQKLIQSCQEGLGYGEWPIFNSCGYDDYCASCERRIRSASAGEICRLTAGGVALAGGRILATTAGLGARWCPVAGKGCGKIPQMESFPAPTYLHESLCVQNTRMSNLSSSLWTNSTVLTACHPG